MGVSRVHDVDVFETAGNLDVLRHAQFRLDDDQVGALGFHRVDDAG